MPIKTLILFLLAISYMPGPNNIMAMNSAHRVGLRKSLPFYCGMAFGFGLVMFLAALFNVALGKLLPRAQPVLGGLGALYMLYLAAKPFLPNRTSVFAEVPPQSCVAGFLVQFLNPMVPLFGLALMSSFVVPYVRSVPMLLLISTGIGILGFTPLILWGLCGALFQRYFSRYETAVNVVMAALLIYCAWSISGFELSFLKACFP